MMAQGCFMVLMNHTYIVDVDQSTVDSPTEIDDDGIFLLFPLRAAL